ncbi:hypothetical protein CDAR_223361 [Caerostris darwini]|uniref:Uncharacterized protein n=1 Tax=Caerostris darwini TaxID=1538125 RepID=A0AAV4W6C4_9ARAC|nr:hypothetical protein CDAR_223361 [Caerostris darwini]
MWENMCSRIFVRIERGLMIGASTVVTTVRLCSESNDHPTTTSIHIQPHFPKTSLTENESSPKHHTTPLPFQHQKRPATLKQYNKTRKEKKKKEKLKDRKKEEVFTNGRWAFLIRNRLLHRRCPNPGTEP